MVAAGRGDEMAAMLKLARAHAESDEEPNTLSYRTTRSEAAPGQLLPHSLALSESSIWPLG